MIIAKLTVPRIALACLLTGTVLLVAAVDRDMILTAFGLLLVIASMVLELGAVLLKNLERVNRPTDDAFGEGYESGYDRGWRDAADEARTRFVVLAGGVSPGERVADTCGSGPQRDAGRASGN